MSIIKAVQDWLGTYDGMELRPLSDIQTDWTDEQPSSYALAPSGNGKTSVDILGNRSYQNSYIFCARETAQNEIDRQDTYDFLDSLTEWIEQQNDAQNFPKLPGRYTVEEIEVSNGMLFEIYEDGSALYQVQIQLIFTKRRD